MWIELKAEHENRALINLTCCNYIYLSSSNAKQHQIIYQLDRVNPDDMDDTFTETFDSHEQARKRYEEIKFWLSSNSK